MGWVRGEAAVLQLLAVELKVSVKGLMTTAKAGAVAKRVAMAAMRAAVFIVDDSL